jgi:hypothetical protein
MSRFLQGLVARARVGQPAIRPPRPPGWLPPDIAVANQRVPAPDRLRATVPSWADAPTASPPEPGSPSPVAASESAPAPGRLRPTVPSWADVAARSPPEPGSPSPVAASERPPAPDRSALEGLSPDVPPPSVAVSPSHVPRGAPAHALRPGARDELPAFSSPDTPLAGRAGSAESSASAVALRPAETPRPAARAMQPTTQQQPGASPAEPAQTTYIHIGRIELHAAPSAVTTQRAPPKPVAHPHMSLDEYLRRRSSRAQ